MTLYGYYRSSTSYRTRIALNLKGLAYDQVAVDLKSGEQQGDAFTSINPHQTVPALEVDGRIRVQSLAILDWLERHTPDPSFSPTNADTAQLCSELYYAIATEIHAPNNVAVLRYLKSEFNADQAALESWCAHWIYRTFEPVEARLRDFKWTSEGFPFGQPTYFEIVLIPQIYNARRWNTDLGAFPLLTQIDAAANALPQFQAAHPDKQPDSPETPS